MAHNNQNTAIFRGYVKFKSNQAKIWGVLILLSIVTTIEVAFGVYKPEALTVSLLGLKLINGIFIALTIVKAYYITWDFMHMRDEKKSLKMPIVISIFILVSYLAFIVLTEASYIHDVLRMGFISWNF